MKKIFVALIALMALAGIAAAWDYGGTGSSGTLDTPGCPDCYANSIIQTDTQSIASATIGPEEEADDGCDYWWDPSVYNEGVAAAIILTPSFSAANKGEGNIVDSFARVEQTMDQTLGTVDLKTGSSEVYNTAMQAAWVEDQGRKELFPPTGTPQAWYVEGAYVSQTTDQDIANAEISAIAGIPTTGTTAAYKVYNADNKLAVITDGLNTLNNFAKSASYTVNDAGTSTISVS